MMSSFERSAVKQRTMNVGRLFHYKQDLLMLALIISLSVVVGGSNQAFFGLDNLFDLLRNGIVIGILAVGVLIALVSGGIDVSFTAIAAFSFYSTVKLLSVWGFEENVILAFVLSASLGLLLGWVNSIFIALLRLPTLIVTLGTLSLFRGCLLTFVGSEYITVLPAGLTGFSKLNVLEGITASGTLYRLPLAFLFLIGVALLSSFLLNRTMIGRGIYALGGSPTAASRAGFHIVRLQFFIYGYIGVLSGLAGLIHASLARMANPFDLVGTELNVIAAVVLGGARISGGYGKVSGTLLGVGLIVVISNSLIMLGVSSLWQKVVIGLLILLGTGVTAIRTRHGANGREAYQ